MTRRFFDIPPLKPQWEALLISGIIIVTWQSTNYQSWQQPRQASIINVDGIITIDVDDDNISLITLALHSAMTTREHYCLGKPRQKPHVKRPSDRSRVVCLLVGTRILSYSHLHQLRSDRTLVPSSSYTPILPSYFLSYWLLPPTATEGGNSGKFKCINVFQTEDGWCDDSRRRTKWDCKQYHHYMIPWIPSLSVYTVLQSTVPTIIIITVFIE